MSRRTYYTLEGNPIYPTMTKEYSDMLNRAVYSAAVERHQARPDLYSSPSWPYPSDDSWKYR